MIPRGPFQPLPYWDSVRSSHSAMTRNGGYLPQHPGFFRLYDIQKHQQGVEHVVSALNPQEKSRTWKSRHQQEITAIFQVE